MLAFNKWGTEGITIEDPGLQNYISLDARLVPKTSARYAGNRFHKSATFIVERLINKVMVPGHKAKKHKRSSGHQTGKSNQAYAMVEAALGEIQKRTGENPIKILVKAIENAAPREEILTIEYGGARYPKAVECAPQRRVDVVLRLFAQGAYQKSFNSKKEYVAALADEIINAHNLSATSIAVAKKQEVERQADSSR